MAEIPKFDPIDRKILGILQADASLPIQTLAEQVGLTANPCWRRVKRLEDEGVIGRRAAIVDPARLGLKLTAFVGLRAGRHDAEWLDGFARAIRSIPEIVECHRLSGDRDYLLKTVVEDVAHYDRVYRRLISTVPNLLDVTAAFSMERLKESVGIDMTTVP
jgi:Lrp/AsnC family transcriptional regulator